MKIGYISDIHLDFNANFPVLLEILNVAKEKQIEMLLVGGDISNKGINSIAAMEDLQNGLGIPVHYIFGNHDYYECGDEFFDLRKKQNTFPVIHNDFGIIADTGWYDYSWYLRGSRNLSTIKHGKISKGFTWPDHRYINFPKVEGDAATWFTQHSLDEMKRQNDILDEKGIKYKIIMTHMVPHEKLLESNIAYLETNVYFGSKKLQEWIQGIKPGIALFGHTHSTHDKTINDVWYVASPVGYSFEWQTSDTYEYINRKLIVLEV